MFKGTFPLFSFEKFGDPLIEFLLNKDSLLVSMKSISLDWCFALRLILMLFCRLSLLYLCFIRGSNCDKTLPSLALDEDSMEASYCSLWRI